MPPHQDKDKEALYQEFVISLANQIRGIERLTVEGTTLRNVEVKANCLHTKLNEFRKALGLRFDEADMEPEVYGENGGGK